MRSRAIPCNVHTYSALMNTCIKTGELELALDVFHQLQVCDFMQSNVGLSVLPWPTHHLRSWRAASRMW